MPAATSAMFFMPQIGLRPDEGEQCTIQHDQNFSNIVVLENRLASALGASLSPESMMKMETKM
jgi:hypothetical protein